MLNWQSLNRWHFEHSSRLAKLNLFLTLLRFNKTRLHSMIGYVSPFEFKKRYYDNLILSGIAA